MGKATIHQQVWKAQKEGNTLKLPKVINSDVGFQLMFGPAENRELEVRKEREQAEKYNTKQYTEEEVTIWLR